MNNEQCREAFESWHGGIYRGLQADIALAAWQAAWSAAQAQQPEQHVEIPFENEHVTETCSSREHIAQQEQPHPQGWKLVPLEPTDQMTYIGQNLRRDSVHSIGAIYRAMLAAAPKHAQQEQPAQGERNG